MTARLYQIVGRLGAKLSLLAAENPELFEGLPQTVTQ
jgi:hypothetical protein